jgi:hypothetical protein
MDCFDKKALALLSLAYYLTSVQLALQRGVSVNRTVPQLRKRGGGTLAVRKCNTLKTERRCSVGEIARKAVIPSDPSGNCAYRLLISNSFYIYRLRMILTVNSDYFLKQR